MAVVLWDVFSNYSREFSFDRSKLLIAVDNGSGDHSKRLMLRDASFIVADAIEVAFRYQGGGNRPTSKKAAMSLISKRFLELVRSQAQIKQADKARPW
jgi:hypothetical protein